MNHSEAGHDPDLADFLGKWRGRWPEWRIAQVFVAESQRDTAEAWFALQQEWADAAWAGEDSTPGFAKLGWWQEELMGWSKGGRRHPLGRVLQKHPAPWAALAAALPALQRVRDRVRAGADPQAVMAALQPLAAAIAVVEHVLFSSVPVSGEAGEDAFALLAAHALWHRDDADTDARIRAWSRQLTAIPSVRAASRPRRINDALHRARLQRMTAGAGASALPPFTALWRSWRAARG